MTDLAGVKETIRQLLNLSENDAAAELEAENAIRFARRLMLRHNLTEEDISDDPPPPRDPHEAAAEEEYGFAKAATRSSRHSYWENLLANAVAKLVGTVGNYRVTGEGFTAMSPRGTVEFDSQGKPRVAARIVFYGPVADCRDAHELFDVWSTTIAAMARMKHGGAFRGPGRSYAEGFAYALLDMVSRAEADDRKLIGAEGERALVLVRHARALMRAKRSAAEVYLSRQGVRLGSGGGLGGGENHGDAYQDGRRDGSRAGFTRRPARRIEG